MARVTKNDELNILRSVPFKEYFAPMGLSKDEYEKRIAMAEDWDDVLMYILALFDIEDEAKARNEKFMREQLEKELTNMLEEQGIKMDDYLTDYIGQISEDIARATFDNIDDPYYLSEDRMHFIAEDQANAIRNYLQYLEATGSKTRKTWMTMADMKVRKTHNAIDHQTVPIDDVFMVGDSFMRFPKDTSHNAEAKEMIGCRCWVEYS